jgi:hypothetical protein
MNEDEIFCAECPLCGDAANPDECDAQGRCPNCPKEGE